MTAFPKSILTILTLTKMTRVLRDMAELTGKQHKDVLKAIRKMEPAWIKICGSIFRLTSRTIVQPNGGTREVPCYVLTKTECTGNYCKTEEYKRNFNRKDKPLFTSVS